MIEPIQKPPGLKRKFYPASSCPDGISRLITEIVPEEWPFEDWHEMPHRYAQPATG